MLESDLIREAWAALTVGEAHLPGEPPTLTGVSKALPSRFPTAETATACIAVALMAAATLRRLESGGRVPSSLDRGHAEAAVRSERFFGTSGASAGMGFAPLSRFWRARDGWVRTHANYPWHRAALLSALDAPEEAHAVGAAIAERSSADIEAAVFAAGGVAAAVRSLDEWLAHPQGAAVHAEPLISHRAIPGAVPRTGGMRVLDLTRVIAGPVCTRFLASVGADVMRIDPPAHPDMRRGAVADTLLGKRSAFLDLSTREGAGRLRDLLTGADVVVCGYRPGALERFGLSEAELAERHPGLVIVFLDAWGHSGPWAQRRGFDSVVQAPTGIAAGEASGEEPGALPCQLLDHGTGYLAAAAALDGLRRQRTEGGTHVRRLSLARTAAWLTSRGTRRPRTATTEDDPTPWLQPIDTPDGPATAVRPPGMLNGLSREWPTRATRYGDDAPEWSAL